MIDEQYIRNRITAIRLIQGKSEAEISKQLGHTKGYINNIVSGAANPSLKELLAICNCLDVSLSEFFNEKTDNPVLMDKASNSLRKLHDKDLLMMINVIDRMRELHNR